MRDAEDEEEGPPYLPASQEARAERPAAVAWQVSRCAILALAFGAIQGPWHSPFRAILTISRSLQTAEWDVGAGAWVLPPLSELAADWRRGDDSMRRALGVGVDTFALSRRFLLAVSGLAMLSDGTALALAHLLRRWVNAPRETCVRQMPRI